MWDAIKLKDVERYQVEKEEILKQNKQKQKEIQSFLNQQIKEKQKLKNSEKEERDIEYQVGIWVSKILESNLIYELLRKYG